MSLPRTSYRRIPTMTDKGIREWAAADNGDARALAEAQGYTVLAVGHDAIDALLYEERREQEIARANNPSEERLRCACGHGHIPGDDGEDSGCRHPDCDCGEWRDPGGAS